jgi:hypothetical protein
MKQNSMKLKGCDNEVNSLSGVKMSVLSVVSFAPSA